MASAKLLPPRTQPLVSLTLDERNVRRMAYRYAADGSPLRRQLREAVPFSLSGTADMVPHAESRAESCRLLQPRGERIQLVLTRREAFVLHTILGGVGGAPQGPRGASDAIQCALDGANAIPYRGDLFDGTGRNTMYLADQWPTDIPEDT